MRHGYPTKTHCHHSGAERLFRLRLHLSRAPLQIFSCAGFYLHIGLTAERGDEIERRLDLPLIACLAPSGAIVSTWQPDFGMEAMRASQRPWPAREDELTALRRSSLHLMHPCSRPDIQSAVLETARATCDIPRRDARTGMPDEGSLVACVAAVSHGKGEGCVTDGNFQGQDRSRQASRREWGSHPPCQTPPE